MPSRVRQPAVAGLFYPVDAVELGETVDALVAAGRGVIGAGHEAPAKALIAPHAGLAYSGPTAGIAMAMLERDREHIERVVIVGPSHYVPVGGLAVSSASAFATPLGPVPVDTGLRDSLLELRQVGVDDRAHAREHSIEVLLPFLQRLLPGLRVLPLAVGEATPTEVAEVLDHVWGDDATRIVVSSDLSHYHDYFTARRRDRATCATIERLDAEALEPDDACGCRAVAGLLAAARARGFRAQTLDLRSSGDTAGPRDRVVGYGAWAFVPPPAGA